MATVDTAPHAAPTDPGSELHDLGWALGAVLRSWRKATDDAVAALPGGQRGYQVLMMATGGPCGTQAAMAERLGLDRTVMTHLIDDLEAAGLVVRRRDPSDRRARRVELTDSGRETYAAAAERVRHVERVVLGMLDDDEAERFRALLDRAAAGAEDQPRDACEVVLELDERG